VKNVIATAALVLAATGAAASLWLASADTALAPEPAMLTQNLSGTTGVSASAVYINTSNPTGVVKWPGSYVYSTTLAAGQPCSTVDLGAWSTATRVIVATGNYRKCA